MGDHAQTSQATASSSSTESELGESFWQSAVQGTGAPLVDPRVPGVTPNHAAMLPWVDDDHHVLAGTDPSTWGDDARQETFERRRRRDAAMQALRSQHATEISGIPAAFVIEEQVVGSTHAFVVARPRIANDLTALVTPSIRASGTADHGLTPHLPATGMHVLTQASPGEIAVQFVPPRAGLFSADLVLEIRWTDGSVDVRTIALHASARLRTEIPEKEVPVSPNAQFHEAADFGGPFPSKDAKPPPSPEQKAAATSKFDYLVQDTFRNAEKVNDRQIDGVHIAADEAKSYTRNPPETSLFYDLMELAVSLGVTMLAGGIARSLTAGIAKSLGRDERSPLVVGLVEGLKDGMKRVGNSAKVKRAVEHLPGGPDRRSSDEAIDVDGIRDPLSSNGRIAFFADQTEMLRDLVDDNTALIAEQAEKLRPLLETDPEQAVAVLRALKDAFVEARSGTATRVQAQSSSLQWVSAVARSSMGSEIAATHDGTYRRNVSAMSNYGSLTDGVLTIDVVTAGDTVAVRAASIRGVSHEIAKRLGKEDLMHAPIPIRLQLANAVIHVDEARRLRVHGVLHADDVPALSEYVLGQNMPEQIEAQSNARAERIVAAVLGKRLAQWGVEVRSDDASGDGDAK